MTYAEAIQFLHSLRIFGARFGLESTRHLAALAGNPHERLRFIHVAGTNGKGSTCALLESVYRAAGWRVGLFTSPHLVAFGERIQVNRRPISEDDVARLVTEMQPWLAQIPHDNQPTFFEVVTVMALRHFAAQQCDLVIWETGLGGRLDATNIVTPLASVITNIALDHQQWLGDTLAQIAAEKAGIIKPGVPVLTATSAPEALAVIAAKARAEDAPLTTIGESEISNLSFEIPLLGEHQRANAALALATVRALNATLPVSAAALRAGLEHVSWPGRLQHVRTPDGRTLLLDGAHNPAGVESLRAALRQHFPHTQPALLLGMLTDKDCAAMCARLAPLARRIALAPVASVRTASTTELAAACRTANPAAVVTTHASLAEAWSALAPEPFVLVTGSLYFVGEAMELLGLSTVPTRDERGLNEWSGQR